MSAGDDQVSRKRRDSGLSSLEIRCPSCAAGLRLLDEGGHCGSCGWSIPITEGFADLRPDPGLDTLLDVESYDADHQVDTQMHQLAGIYERILRNAGVEGPVRAIELGAGSGNLTYGLVRAPYFDTVVTSDVSPSFLRLLRRRVGDPPAHRLTCVLLDANRLPFVDGAADCVLGHSILHHLAEFERTVTEARRVLRPGGAAVFGEPVMDVHAFSSMICANIIDFEAAAGRTLPPGQTRVLKAVAGRSQLKTAHLLADRGSLGAIEDKFWFSLAYMRDLARKAGFQSVEMVTEPPDTAFGERIRNTIIRIFRRAGEDHDLLSNYDFLFENLTTAYAGPVGMADFTPFGYFVFRT